MSTNMRLYEEAMSQYEFVGFLPVDGKRIVARELMLQHPLYQYFLSKEPFPFVEIKAAALWGVLRSNAIIEVDLTVTDPTYILVQYRDSTKRTSTYKMKFSDYDEFLTYYCGKNKRETNWREEGF